MTIRDIARESGYAVSTVSRVLNNHPDVSPEAKKHIDEIVSRHGFVPNNNARQLKAQQPSGILILVKGAFNSFFAAILERIQLDISSAGYSAEVHYIDEDADEVLVSEQLIRERKPLGIIYLGGSVDGFKARFKHISVPCVLATTVSQALNFKNLSQVGVDDEKAGADACSFLLENNHRRIAVIGGRVEMSYISKLRLDGFKSAYKAATNEEFDDKYYQHASFNLESGYKAMNKLLARCKDITAVFCMSDILAIGAKRAITEAGLKIPEDISILGFDGISLTRFCTPSLCTLMQPQQEIARTSVKLLLAQITGGEKAQTVIMNAVVESGESVAKL